MSQDETAKARVLAQVDAIRERQQAAARGETVTRREIDDLHRLAFEYRNARLYGDAEAAFNELERYVGAQVAKSFEAGRAYECGLKHGSWLEEQNKGVGKK